MSKILKLLFKNMFLTAIILNLSIPLSIADDSNELLDSTESIQNQILETSTTSENLPNINSRAAVVIDRNSNTVLFGKSENEKRKMASTTKIMTCLVVIENCNLKDDVTISKKSAGTGGSRLGLKTNDKISVQDLLYGLMLRSGNDAAVALAEYVSGSVDDFSILMNTKAKELGLKDTNFETPHGLDSENHYTTAYELALLANYALNNKTFYKIVGTKSYTVTINGYHKQISNTNELLGNLNGVYGIKTGFTNGANRCLVTACKRDNLDIICVVLGADTKKFRTQDSIKLIEYVFKTYELVNIKEIIDTKFEDWKEGNLNSFSIAKGENNNLSLKIESLEHEIIPIDRNLLNSINVIFTCNKTLNAPVYKDTVIGKVCVSVGNNEIINLDILTDCNINKKSVSTYLKELLSAFTQLKLADFI